jgi:hypothetical protein
MKAIAFILNTLATPYTIHKNPNLQGLRSEVQSIPPFTWVLSSSFFLHIPWMLKFYLILFYLFIDGFIICGPWEFPWEITHVCGTSTFRYMERNTRLHTNLKKFWGRHGPLRPSPWLHHWYTPATPFKLTVTKSYCQGRHINLKYATPLITSSFSQVFSYQSSFTFFSYWKMVYKWEYLGSTCMPIVRKYRAYQLLCKCLLLYKFVN